MLIRFSTSGGYEYWLFYDGGTNEYTLPAGSSPIGRWNHYAFVKSNGAISFYFNGVKLGNSPSSGHIAALCLGGNDVDFGGGYYRCYIDNFIISDTARYTDDFTPPESPVWGYYKLFLKDKEVWGMKE